MPTRDPFVSDAERLALLERYYVRPDRPIVSDDGRVEYQELMKELGRERQWKWRNSK